MESRVVLLFIVLSFVALALFVVDLATGAVPIPLGDVWAALAGGDAAPATAKIVRDIRLVKAVVAVAAGMALSVSGLQMQTLFRNPLAGPYVLGISSGASLGVALFILGAPLFGAAAGGGGPMASLGMAGAAWVGSASILLVIAAVSRRIRDIMVILILGMMFSSGVGAVVQILQYLSREEALKSFVIWTMGSLGDVTAGQLALLLPAVALGLGLSVAAVKPLNLLLLGEPDRLRGARRAPRGAHALPRCRPPRADACVGAGRRGRAARLRHRIETADAAREYDHGPLGHSGRGVGRRTQQIHRLT